MAIITDEQIRAAWAADEEQFPGQVRVGHQVATNPQFWSAVRQILEGGATTPALVERVAAVRDRLGGWDAVWRSVLEDCGFTYQEARTPYGLPHWTATIGPLVINPDPATKLLFLFGAQDIAVPLAGPSDLRRRVRLLREALEPGTKGGTTIIRAVNSHDELLAALEELTAACEEEFVSPDVESEESAASVWAGGPNGKGITFGKIRRARAAIAKAEGADHA